MKKLFYGLLNLIDDGRFLIKPTKWYYRLKGIPPFVLPVLSASVIPGLKFFRNLNGAFGAYLLLVLLTIYLLGVAIFVFALWWNRSNRLEEKVRPGDDAVAIPLFADNIKSSGEIFAIMTALIGFGFSLFLFLIMASTDKEVLFDDVHFYRKGVWLISLCILVFYWLFTAIASYSIIFITRFISEKLRLMATMNNNLRDVADIHRAAVLVENADKVTASSAEQAEQ